MTNSCSWGNPWGWPVTGLSVGDQDVCHPESRRITTVREVTEAAWGAQGRGHPLCMLTRLLTSPHAPPPRAFPGHTWFPIPEPCSLVASPAFERWFGEPRCLSVISRVFDSTIAFLPAEGEQLHSSHFTADETRPRLGKGLA